MAKWLFCLNCVQIWEQETYCLHCGTAADEEGNAITLKLSKAPKVWTATQIRKATQRRMEAAAWEAVHCPVNLQKQPIKQQLLKARQLRANYQSRRQPTASTHMADQMSEEDARALCRALDKADEESEDEAMHGSSSDSVYSLGSNNGEQ